MWFSKESLCLKSLALYGRKPLSNIKIDNYDKNRICESCFVHPSP